ncbi:c-type cytochrome [Ilumatobacter sp.]|uniref:cytochrome bc1 complex diheme cytochrome c subunit n=1 Tax=Ilumatobacter sp. TaxID=1967498 RepID=UPI003B5294E8
MRTATRRALAATPLVAASGLAIASLLAPDPAAAVDAARDAVGAVGDATAAAEPDDGEAGDGEAGESVEGDAEVAALGADLYATQCSSCHGLDGLGVDERGPSLEPEGRDSADFVLRTGRMPLADPNLQARSGPIRYSEAEIVALVAYVARIGDGPDVPDVDASRGDVSSGGRLYRLNCAACHVASGAGAPIGGGREAPNLVSSSPVEVGEAILVGPGAMPVFESLSGDDIDDIAAYVEELAAEDTTSASSFGGAGPVAEGLAAFIIGLIPLVALTRWIGSPKEGRDRPLDGDDIDDLSYPLDEREEPAPDADPDRPGGPSDEGTGGGGSAGEGSGPPRAGRGRGETSVTTRERGT